MAEYKFRVFGLVISSCIFCPELLPGTGDVDATVAYGSVPEPVEKPRNPEMWHDGKPGQLICHVAGVARVLVRNGNEIIIDRAPNSTDEDIRLFLLGSALGAMLHQRGVVVLHGSIIKITNDSCILFVGHSGMGKSTLAAVLNRRGYPWL